MKACVLRECGPIADRPLSYEDVEQPTPGPGEALIRVRTCGVCRTDLHVIEGELDQSKQRMPVIPGHQVVGEIVEEVGELAAGSRVGVAWLNCTCGMCRFCQTNRENLCTLAEFTGWTRDGGYAEYIVAPGDFVYPLPDALSDEQVAPLLCAGIIGYRCLERCAVSNWRGAQLGIYGFGAAGHIAIQLAKHRGADVYVCTRDGRHQKLAEEMGATWVGGTIDEPPVPLDAAIIFAPAGEIVPATLRALDRGGRVVCGGIHMSAIPDLEYADLYWEREIVSVANNTRADGCAFLCEAAEANVQTHVETFRLSEANDALIRLKTDAIRGAAVLVVAE